ncbi:polysaccharide deacetylase [Bacteroides cellulosilyticus]|nr:polysaccharide deacetylase [Bacteroides cellulosilyticus]
MIMKKIILMYHDVFKSSPAESGFQNNGALIYKISVEHFERQVQLLSQYCSCSGLDKSSVLFSFDDGGISFHTYIASILENYDFRGLFFISTFYIGKKGFLSEEQIKDLFKRGHFIGAHSHTHPTNMKYLADNELLQEWDVSCAILRNVIGENITVGSIPGGSCSRRVIQTMNTCGIDEVYTSIPTIRVKEKLGCKVFGRYGVKSVMSDKYVLSIVTSKTVRNKIFLKKELLGIAKIILGDKYTAVRKHILYRRKEK